MKVTPKNFKARKFQMGGTMELEAPVEEPMLGGEAPVEEPAPAEGGLEDPMIMLAQMSTQALLNQDCLMAMQVCQAFVLIAQQIQGGGAPAEELGEPVFAKKGAKLIRRIKK